MRRAKKHFLRAWLSQGIWLLLRVCCLVILRRKVTVCVEGREHIPRKGPVLIAARHFHYLYDGYSLVRTVPRRLHIVVALDWLKMRSLRLLIELACALAGWPVVLREDELRRHAEGEHWAYQRTEGRRYIRRAMQAAVRLLRAGEVLVIFPEGYPNIDPHHTPKQDLEIFLPFQAGFLKMAELAERDKQTRVAIVAAGLTYARDAKKRWRTTVRFGPAIFLHDFSSTEEALHAVEQQVQELSHAVSSVRKQELPGEMHLP